MFPIGGATVIISLAIILVYSLVKGAARLFGRPLKNNWYRLTSLKDQQLAMITICLVMFIVIGISIQIVSIALGKENSSLAFARDMIFECPAPVLKEGVPAVILRLDDVQAFGWSNISMMMIKDAAAAGFPITAGVIPKDIEDDIRISKFLSNHRCVIELAQHGYDHVYSAKDHSLGEFATIDLKEAQKRLIKGRNILKKYTDEPINVFIPPHNQLSDGSVAALASTGFTVISSGDGGFLDYDTSTYDFIENRLVPAETVITDCIERFSQGDLLCIIILHPQDFAKDIGSADPILYAEYQKILAWLTKNDMPVITLREALSRKSELSPNTENR